VTDAEDRPLAVEVVKGNTRRPRHGGALVEKLKLRFGLREVVLVGDRGMLTSARIEALRATGGVAWISAQRGPQIPPGGVQEPLLAEERARKREDLLQATEAKLAPIVAAVTAGRLRGAAAIGLRLGRVLGKHKVGKHFDLAITGTSLTRSSTASTWCAPRSPRTDWTVPRWYGPTSG
jgi:hypothetical protein